MNLATVKAPSSAFAIAPALIAVVVLVAPDVSSSSVFSISRSRVDRLVEAIDFANLLTILVGILLHVHTTLSHL